MKLATFKTAQGPSYGVITGKELSICAAISATSIPT